MEEAEKTRSMLLAANLRIREDVTKNSHRLSRDILVKGEDVKMFLAEDHNRVLQEVYQTVDENGDLMVRRMKVSTKKTIKNEVRGTYFAPEVRENMAQMELAKKRGLR